uniref:Uncharacterized protein n=1 Tax=viral metagenome TaxID=1070528 RepID=A0A6C0HCJ0_9ZZZZ
MSKNENRKYFSEKSYARLRFDISSFCILFYYHK